MRRVAAFVPNLLGTSPGQRLRIEAWAPYLERAGWQVVFHPFENDVLHRVLYRPGHLLIKAQALFDCYLRQQQLIFSAAEYDVAFVFREAALIGPAFLEREMARQRVPIIYDIDDPVFLPYRSPTNRWFSLLKWPWKTHSLFRLSSQVLAVNELIGGYARRYSRHVTVIPNCVQLDQYPPRDGPRGDAPMRMVWIGSHSTAANLAAIADPVRQLQAETGAQLRVIGAGVVELRGLTVETRQWSAASEIADLQECDVGLVPVRDHPWNAWKFFFKVVQYMAAGLPVVAQRTGSNAEVIEDGSNGFLVETPREWYERLSVLARDAELRRRMGTAARQTAVERFSLDEHAARVVSVFEKLTRRDG